MAWSKKKIAEDDELPEIPLPLAIVDFSQLTFENVDAFRAELGLQWRGAWQIRIMRALIDNRFCIVKGPRQNSGKTWCIALLMAFCIAKLGMGWVIGLPTIRQGSRILADRVSTFIAYYEQKSELKRIIRNAGYMTWNNGGLLAVVSLHEGSRAGVQGFTAHGLVLDEGHEYDRVIYDAILPVLDVAAADDLSRVIVSGVGGFPGFSLIWELQQPLEDPDDDEDVESFDLVHIGVDEIGADSPKLAKFFAKKKRSVPEESWRRYYLCEDFAEGGNVIFSDIAAGFPNLHMNQGKMSFGIDVGRSKDYTIVVAIREYMEYIEVVDVLRMRGQNFKVQSEQITKWIDQWNYLPFDIRIEKNNLGVGLYDFIREVSGFRQITPVTTSDDPPTFRKSKWIHALMHRSRQGRFAVADPRIRKDLLELQFEQKEDGRYIWPHNDVLSALWIWQSRAVKSFAA